MIESLRRWKDSYMFSIGRKSAPSKVDKLLLKGSRDEGFSVNLM